MPEDDQGAGLARTIDWSGLDKYGPSFCECKKCGAEFRSHTKFVWIREGVGRMVCKDPCPKCGHHYAGRTSSPPEKMVIGPGGE
jgi:hypothetical protein